MFNVVNICLDFFYLYEYVYEIYVFIENNIW